MATLVLLRHGESEWNKLNLFTGWVDVDLTELGEEQARLGGLQLAEDDSAMVVASGSEDVLQAGKFVRVSVDFANGETAELNVPVMAPGETYDEVELP